MVCEVCLLKYFIIFAAKNRKNDWKYIVYKLHFFNQFSLSKLAKYSHVIDFFVLVLFSVARKARRVIDEIHVSFTIKFQVPLRNCKELIVT